VLSLNVLLHGEILRADEEPLEHSLFVTKYAFRLASPIGLFLVLCGCQGFLGAKSDSEGRDSSTGPGNDSTSGDGDGDGPATDPGRVTLHRLNNAEYNNTVRDLLKTEERPADSFPIDNRGSGFDNIADVLTLSPLHLDLMYTAIESLIQTALTSAEQRAALLDCDLEEAPEICLENTLTRFAERAWRRPASDEEVTRLLAVAQVAIDAGDSTELGLELALRATLLSPHFLFRVELDPEPTSLTPHALTSHELASRLSYFLWSSMPDDELLAAAEAEELGDAEALSAQVERMLADEKSSALLDNFAGQWLGLRGVENLHPDQETFPDFDESLRSSMMEETSLMFQEVLFGGLPVNEFLVSDFTFMNDRLAAHYGLPAVGSDELQRVELDNGGERGGFLSHASFLSLTSHPDRTSVVHRGKWVLNELLCTEVPAPPPDVSTEAIDEGGAEGLSQREALELHRSEPGCISCHEVMDPIGFGLENYDAVGAYRTSDGEHPVDSSGVLPDGSSFSGAEELSGIVAGDPKFAACVTEKLYTYALGRAPTPSTQHMDTQVLANITSDFSRENHQFQRLIHAIATSETFRNRRGESSEGETP